MLTEFLRPIYLMHNFNPSYTELPYIVKNCVVNGIKIKKGVRFQFPIQASHFDPEFFPEPEKFKPERFLKENSEKIIPYTWRPFGCGYRGCIGQRFAMMEMKIFLAKFFSRFKVFLSPKSGLTEDIGTYGFYTYEASYAIVEPRL